MNNKYAWRLIGNVFVKIEILRHERWIKKGKRLAKKFKRLHKEGKVMICFDCYLRNGKSNEYHIRKKCKICGGRLVSTKKLNELIPPTFKKYNDFMSKGLAYYYKVEPKDVKIEFFRQELIKVDN